MCIWLFGHFWNQSSKRNRNNSTLVFKQVLSQIISTEGSWIPIRNNSKYHSTLWLPLRIGATTSSIYLWKRNSRNEKPESRSCHYWCHSWFQHIGSCLKNHELWLQKTFKYLQTCLPPKNPQITSILGSASFLSFKTHPCVLVVCLYICVYLCTQTNNAARGYGK